MHAHAKRRVKAAAKAICEDGGCSCHHAIASDAIGAGDDALRLVFDGWAEEMATCGSTAHGVMCDRCRGRKDVIDSVKTFLVPS